MDRLIFEKALDFITHYFTQEQVFRIVDKKVSERYFKINEKGNEQSHIKIGKFDLVFKTTLKADGREERFTHWAEMMKTFGQVQPELLQGMLPLMLKDTDSPIVADVEELLAQAELIAQSAQNLAQENAQNQNTEAQAQQGNTNDSNGANNPSRVDVARGWVKELDFRFTKGFYELFIQNLRINKQAHSQRARQKRTKTNPQRATRNLQCNL